MKSKVATPGRMVETMHLANDEVKTAMLRNSAMQSTWKQSNLPSPLPKAEDDKSAVLVQDNVKPKEKPKLREKSIEDIHLPDIPSDSLGRSL